MDMNFSRQMELFDAENNKERVVVIGAGATGSWVSLCLTKLGVFKLNIVDDDTIDLHNIPNQFFNTDQIGMFKASAINNNARLFGSKSTILDSEIQRVEGDTIFECLGGYDTVFCLVDSMSARKEIFESILDSRKEAQDNDVVSILPKLWIETRMGLTGYRLYMIDLDDDYQVEEYRKTLYSDDEAEVSACGASQSVITTAMQCASHAVGMFLAKINNAEYIPNELIYDIQSTILLHREFKKKEE